MHYLQERRSFVGDQLQMEEKMWQNVEAAPADSILGLTEAFRDDQNPDKVNLGVGVYKDEEGNTPVLGCVKTAERELLAAEATKSYLPIPGNAVYSREVQKLIFGADNPAIGEKRAVTAHTPGGTGALRVGAELLKKFTSGGRVWVPRPTWANHRGVFGSAGFQLADYRYYSPESKDVDFEAMVEDLEAVPAGDIVLLHACCHNPSGADLQPEQWQRVVELCRNKGWFAFLDFAYQGFGGGLEKDRYAVEQFLAAGVDFFVASSFSKNFGLYNERVGALTIVSASEKAALVALSHLKATIRVLYSNPAAHGGLVVSRVLADEVLRQQWLSELAEMSGRIKDMRTALAGGLEKRGVAEDFSYITRQRGMFSFSGLSDAIVRWLREEKAIYIVGGGRINLAGLTRSNIDYVCDAIAEALKR